MGKENKWAKIDAAQIANECSPRHIQSVIEDAQKTIAILLNAAIKVNALSIQSDAHKELRAAIHKATE